jgi:hypothetical protein
MIDLDSTLCNVKADPNPSKSPSVCDISNEKRVVTFVLPNAARVWSFLKPAAYHSKKNPNFYFLV